MSKDALATAGARRLRRGRPAIPHYLPGHKWWVRVVALREMLLRGVVGPPPSPRRRSKLPRRGRRLQRLGEKATSASARAGGKPRARSRFSPRAAPGGVDLQVFDSRAGSGTPLQFASCFLADFHQMPPLDSDFDCRTRSTGTRQETLSSRAVQGRSARAERRFFLGMVSGAALLPGISPIASRAPVVSQAEASVVYSSRE